MNLNNRRVFAAAATIGTLSATLACIDNTTAQASPTTITDAKGVTWPTDSVVNNPLGDNVPIADNSSTFIQSLSNWQSSQQSKGQPTWYMYSGTGTSNPIIHAAATDPTYNIIIKDPKTGVVDDTKSGYLKGIHIPAGALPATGTDHQLAVIEPDGSEVDLWDAAYDASNGTWAAGNGGRIVDPSATPGADFPVSGAYDSSSGLSKEAFTITPDEMKQAINTDTSLPHPLMVSIPGMFENGDVSKPALNHDSWAGVIKAAANNASIGQMLILPKTLDVDAMNLPAIDKVILKTFQTRGGIIVDTTSQPGTVTDGVVTDPNPAGIVNISLENPSDFTSRGQADPWPALYNSETGKAWSGKVEDWNLFTGCGGACDAIPTNRFELVGKDYLSPAAVVASPSPSPTTSVTPSAPASSTTPTAPATTPTKKPTTPTKPKPVITYHYDTFQIDTATITGSKGAANLYLSADNDRHLAFTELRQEWHNRSFKPHFREVHQFVTLKVASNETQAQEIADLNKASRIGHVTTTAIAGPTSASNLHITYAWKLDTAHGARPVGNQAWGSRHNRLQTFFARSN